MNTSRFGGDIHLGVSILTRPENWFVAKGLPLIPRWMETYHLTALTLLWSGLIVVFGFQARTDLNWLAGIALMIACQYVTDVFDGKIGKLRNTGLIKWGFYMDHLLDYLFLCAIVISYALIAPPGLERYFLALLALLGAVLAHTFLAFAATNQLRVQFFGFGPTEGRLLFILVNLAIIWTGTGYFTVVVPVAVLATAVVLLALVIRQHRQLWHLDMEAKMIDTARWDMKNCRELIETPSPSITDPPKSATPHPCT